MTKELQIFNYDGQEVRTVEQDGEVWFVAKDVCDVLEMTTEATRRLDKDEKGLTKIQTLNGKQDMVIINEPGLYKLIFRSKKPQAKSFTRWVTHEVLPQIRRTGHFEAERSEPQTTLPAHSGVIKAAEKIIDKAFNCVEEADFQAVVALDKVFKETFGKSALKIAQLNLVDVHKCIVYTGKQGAIYKEDEYFSRWTVGDPSQVSLIDFEVEYREIE